MATSTTEASSDGSSERAVGDGSVDGSSVGGDGDEELLAVLVGSCWLGLPIEFVVAVCELSRITPIPLSPPHVSGLMAYQGEPLPVVDLALFLSLDGAQVPDAALDDGRPMRAVVAAVADMRVALVCHRVRGVSTVTQEQMRPPETTRGQALHQYVTAEIDLPKGMLSRIDLVDLVQAARVRGVT